MNIDEQMTWAKIVHSAREYGYVDISRGFGSTEESKEIDAILAAHAEMHRLRMAIDTVLSRLSDDFPSGTFVGKDFTVQDVRDTLRAALKAVGKEEKEEATSDPIVYFCRICAFEMEKGKPCPNAVNHPKGEEVR